MYLKISNPGTVPVECFTVLGVSLADTCNDKRLIGKFGSGTKNAIALCLREGLAPTVITGGKRLDFSLSKLTITDGLAEKTMDRVAVTVDGQTTPLGMTIDFGKFIWDDVTLALREFVSNAIDYGIRSVGHWDDVTCDLVKSVEMAEGTHIYVPINDEVLLFWNNIDKWFLHFGDEKLLNETVLVRNGRNHVKGNMGAVIYRRGVYVREIRDSSPAVFDYNIEDIDLDEARKATDWEVQYRASLALHRCNNVERLKDYLSSGLDTWEQHFDSYGEYDMNKTAWVKAYYAVAGDKIAVMQGGEGRVEARGLECYVVASRMFKQLRHCGVRTSWDVLSKVELDGMELTDPSDEAVAEADDLWSWLVKRKLTRKVPKPKLKAFVGGMVGGETTWGRYENGTVYVKHTASGWELYKTLLDEFTHHITGSSDNSRDFQEFLFDVILAMRDER